MTLRSARVRGTASPGERTFVDFSGDGMTLVDPRTGECATAKLFAAVLGASNLTYIEPVLSEDLPTWIQCHVNAFAYFGGVTEIVVPDNLKSGVTKPDFLSYYEAALKLFGIGNPGVASSSSRECLVMRPPSTRIARTRHQLVAKPPRLNMAHANGAACILAVRHRCVRPEYPSFAIEAKRPR